MDDDIDPYDVLEEGYEDQYADEIEMMEETEKEIDFIRNEQPKKLKQYDLDKRFLPSQQKPESLVNKNESSLLKRNFEYDSDDELVYSDDEMKDIDLQTKKQKLSHSSSEFKSEQPKIKNTSAARKLLDQLRSTDKSSNDDVATYVQSKRVFTRPVLGMESVNVTSTCGERVYMRLHPSHTDAEANEICSWQKNSSASGLNLLSLPFQELLDDILNKRHERQLQKINELKNQNNNNHNQQKNDKPLELWVEKYQPRQYTELLSDDGTNRMLLRWLKLWDEVVFQKKPSLKKPPKKNSLNQINKDVGKNDLKNQKKPFFNLEDDLVLDKNGRPKKKIALLCGNPGLGKTTLAHVISKHAGYNTVEMNASDDRSPDVFLNKIESSTQMKAVIGLSKKPNCLVIDEIDGAPAPAIKILLDIIKYTEGVGGPNKKNKKKSRKEFILNRPIICICNDQYVPALRQLRQLAFVLNFPPTIPSRLASRLLVISQIEELRIDMGSLLQLTDKTENDIRSCLNTLQFINEKQTEVKPEDIINMEVGQKDFKKGVRSIIDSVFRLPRTNKRGKQAQRFNKTEGGKTNASHRFYSMLHLVSGNTDTDKLSQGMFDQYLSVKSKDPYLESVLLATGWLEFFDFIQLKVQSTQNYVLHRYSPFLTVAFHMYFAQAANPKLIYSNIAYENHLKQTHNVQTLDLMVSGIEPSLRRYCTRKVCISDIVPYLFYITMPSLRPVNTQLYSESEKQMLFNLISTMISYHLTYRQERAVEGHYTYLLEPNIEELITYTGLPQHRHLPYATKQLIAREVELERMRIAEGVIKVTSAMHATSNKSNTPASKQILEKQRLEPKLLKKCMDNERPQLDFFGRIVKASSFQNNTPKEQKAKLIDQLIYTDVRFKFNEGYTNAVRRPVKIQEFL